MKTVCLFRSVVSRESENVAIADLNRIERELPDSITRADIVVREGDPAVGIVAAAERGDLIVMATHGRGGFDRFWHGSVAERVLHRARVPVLLVRAGSDVFLELGAPTFGRQAMGPGVWLASLEAEGASDWDRMIGSLGALYERGLVPNWRGVYAGQTRTPISLPGYPFERRPCWPED